ncbi:MAG: EAL domain-containing protein [Pseudomonadota bacterium]
MRILLVDDDLAECEMVLDILQSGFSTTEIRAEATVASALSAIEEKLFDVILIKYELPDGCGLDIIKSIRKNYNKQVAILLFSATDSDEIAEQGLQAGAQDFLLKESFQPRLLMRSIRQARHRVLMDYELSQTHNKLRELAERDSLTGLYNRYFFNESLRATLLRAERYQNGVGLLLLDLDHFKYINDTYGHGAGDELLKEVARRLISATRAGDLLCRLGGDEFAILVHNVESENDVWLLANRVLLSLQSNMILDGVKIVISASVGMAVYPSSAADAEQLLSQADLAMYRSKKRGRNGVSCYSDELNEHVRRRVSLERELREAILHYQFELYYQPEVCAFSGKIIAVEALLRWHHPLKGLLSAGEFLDVAEDSGLINSIGEWVLLEACKQCMLWQKNGHSELRVGVNLSSNQLRTEAMVAHVEQALEKSALPSHCLELEITENTIIDKPARVIRTLNQLVSMGVRIALDNFGVGFSPLSHLRDFPLNVLKIDQTFLRDAESPKNGVDFLKAVILMAKSRQLITVLEGVETQEQAELVKAVGGDSLQGYLYSKPVSSEAMGILLNKNK